MSYSRIKRWLVALALLWLLGCDAAPPAPACFDQDPAARAELQRLVAEQGRTKILATAEFQSLQDLHARFPQAPQVRKLLQHEYLGRQDFASLIALQQEIPESQRSRDDELLLIHGLTSLKRHGPALERVLPLLEAQPQEASLLWLAGYNAFHLGELERAAAFFDAGWDGILAEGYDEVLALRALIHLYAEELEQAEALATRAVMARPLDIVARNAQARILQAQGRSEDAERAFAELDRLQKIQDEKMRLQHLSISLMRAIQDAWQQRSYLECEKLIEQALPVVSGPQRLQLFRLMVTVFNETGRPADAQEMQRRLDALDQQGEGQ